MDLSTSISAKLHVVNTKISRQISRAIQEHTDLRLPEWRVAALLANEGPLRQSQIGELAGMDKGQISRTVKTMLASGLIVRDSASAKARNIPFSLTKYGWEVQKNAAATIEQLNAGLISKLSHKEQQSICASLDAIEKSVDQR